MRPVGHQEREKGEAPESARRKRLWLLWLAWLAVGALIACVAGAVMAILLQQPVSELEQAVALVRRWKYAGVAIQTLAALVLVMRWKAVVAWCVRKGILVPDEIDEVVADQRPTR